MHIDDEGIFDIFHEAFEKELQRNQKDADDYRDQDQRVGDLISFIFDSFPITFLGILLFNDFLTFLISHRIGLQVGI